MRAVKTLFLLTALTLLLVLGGDAIAGQQGMTLGLIIAVVMNGVAYFFSDKIALRSSGAQPVTREQLPRLYEVMERLVAKAQLPMPKLYVIPQPAPNAFATGRNPKHAAVAVTQGLVNQLPTHEIEGVLAHEFGHIKNRDILVSSIAAMVAGAISAIANILQFSLLFGGSDDDDSPLGMVGALAAIIVAPIAAMLLQLAVSRQREYLADATGAQLLGRAAPLADALERLERGAEAAPMNLNPAEASLYAVNPLPRAGLAALFQTHPPIAERVRRLRALDGDRPLAMAA